jgi:hypothetical protein
VSELNPEPPRKDWQAPGDDRRRPSSVATEYKGRERRGNEDSMFESPPGRDPSGPVSHDDTH